MGLLDLEGCVISIRLNLGQRGNQREKREVIRED